MNVADAAHATVRDYPGGAESLGPRVDVTPAVLRSKVNTGIDTHHLTLREADSIMAVSGDHRMLHALAAEHGYTLQRSDADTAGNLLGSFLAAGAAKGDLSKAFADALADNVVTKNEAKVLNAIAARLMARVAELAAQATRAAGGAP